MTDSPIKQLHDNLEKVIKELASKGLGAHASGLYGEARAYGDAEALVRNLQRKEGGHIG